MKNRSFIVLIMLLMLMFSVSSQVLAQPPDRDGDGVPDTADRCISVAGPASNDGCPLPDTSTESDTPSRPDDIPPDTDGDGTADPLDSCPTVPGDGANGGCPEGTDPNAQPVGTQNDAPTLLSAPVSDGCIVSPIGAIAVNIRIGAHPDADISHVLQVNEWAQVLGAAYQADYPPFQAEHEPAMMIPFGIQAPIVDPDPDPIDDFAVNKPIWLLIETTDGFIGWVNAAVIRYGGDCSDLVLPEDNPEVLEMIFMPADDNGVGFPNENPFLFFPVNPDPDPMPTFEFDILFPSDPSVPSGGTSILAPNCELYSPEAGVFILICDEDAPEPIVDTMGSLIPPDCELLNPEAGVFILDCSPDTPVPAIPMPSGDVLPENCELVNPEAGVFILICDEDVDPTPIIDTMGTLIPPDCELVNPEAGVFYLDCTPDEETTFSPANTGFDFAPACMYVEQEAGVFVLECANGDTPTIMYCILELGSEAGMYVEVCYEIEIPEGCTVDTSEAGVWHFDCDDDGTVVVTPFGNDLPILTADDNNDAVLIGLLLPAVQKVREAAAR